MRGPSKDVKSFRKTPRSPFHGGPFLVYGYNDKEKTRMLLKFLKVTCKITERFRVRLGRAAGVIKLWLVRRDHVRMTRRALPGS